MKNNQKVRIGCASAFWGDTSTAAKQLVEKGDLDYLVFDFLAEVTMSILARAKLKDSNKGFAGDFLTQVEPLLPTIKQKGIKILTNAGGINPTSCRTMLEKAAKKEGIDLKIGIVTGDDLVPEIPKIEKFGITDLDTGNPFPKSCLSINAYLGASGLVAALDKGADIVITGRCVDSALVLAPLMHEFGWNESDYNLLASGSLAGHIIECGAQCTGGNFTDWKDVNGFEDMGFPIVEVEENGDFIVSKPDGTGGMVTFGTVAEQFLYEIGNPAEYILPDVVCDFTEVTIKDLGKDRVHVSGASGSPPTDQYKVSATFMDGYRVNGTLVIGGRDSDLKGEIIANAVIKKVNNILKEKGLDQLNKTSYDLIGTDSIYGKNHSKRESKEIVLRLASKHQQKEALIILSQELAQAVTGMPAGVINYLGGRPPVSPSIELFSFLYAKDQVKVEVDIEGQISSVRIGSAGGYNLKMKNVRLEPKSQNKSQNLLKVPLFKLAFARSGDKGNHANIGVIARKPEYFGYINNELTSKAVENYFSHVSKGKVLSWCVPSINGINFLLKDSLGGGGMASMSIDPQGKSYAQQLLDYEIPVDDKLFSKLKET